MKERGLTHIHDDLHLNLYINDLLTSHLARLFQPQAKINENIPYAETNKIKQTLCKSNGPEVICLHNIPLN